MYKTIIKYELKILNTSFDCESEWRRAFTVKQTQTCSVVPGQENLNQVCVDRHLSGECHVGLDTAQNLHTDQKLNKGFSAKQDAGDKTLSWEVLCCLHELVGAAGQTAGGEARQEVGGDRGQERTKPDVKPQRDEGGIGKVGCAEAVQLLYSVQDHWHCRVTGVQCLQRGRVAVRSSLVMSKPLVVLIFCIYYITI